MLLVHVTTTLAWFPGLSGFQPRSQYLYPGLGAREKSLASPPSQGTGPGNRVAASLLKVGPPPPPQTVKGLTQQT